MQSRQRDAWAEMLSKIIGTPASEIRAQYCEPHDVRAAVNRRIALHERELLSKTSLGQQILRLREEKEELQTQCGWRHLLLGGLTGVG